MVDIAESAELKQALLDSLGRCGLRLTIAPEAVLDVTAVQLLWAAGNQARSRNLRFELAESLPESFSRQMTADGFDVERIFAGCQPQECAAPELPDEEAAGASQIAVPEPEPERGRAAAKQVKSAGRKHVARAGKRVR